MEAPERVLPFFLNSNKKPLLLFYPLPLTNYEMFIKEILS